MKYAVKRNLLLDGKLYVYGNIIDDKSISDGKLMVYVKAGILSPVKTKKDAEATGAKQVCKNEKLRK